MTYSKLDLAIDRKILGDAFKDRHPHQDLLCAIVEAHDRLTTQVRRLHYECGQHENKIVVLQKEVCELRHQLDNQQSSPLTDKADAEDRSYWKAGSYRTKYLDHFLAHKAGKRTVKNSPQEHGGSR